MPEVGEQILSTETDSITPVKVMREGESKRESPIITVDGELLAEALAETGHNSSVAVPLVIDAGESGIGALAHYDNIRRRVVLYENSFITCLKQLRDQEYAYLDDEVKAGNLQKITTLAKMYLNPIRIPYSTLRDHGAIHTYSGNSERLSQYLAQAREGFTVTKNGDTKQLSKEESVERAKLFMDGLIEKAAPGILGWVIAHEYEHREHAKQKFTTTGALMGGPISAAIAAVEKIGPHLSSADSTNVLVAGVMAGVIGGIIGNRMNEKASYDAGDANLLFLRRPLHSIISNLGKKFLVSKRQQKKKIPLVKYASNRKHSRTISSLSLFLCLTKIV